MDDKITTISSVYYQPVKTETEGKFINSAMTQKWNIMEDLILSFVLFLISY